MISRKLAERILVCMIVLLAIGFTGAAVPVALKVTTETGLVRFAAQENVQQLRVEILTLTGQNVFDSGVLQGTRELAWQMQNKLGFRVASGLYLYKVTMTDTAGNNSQRFGKFPVLTQIKEPIVTLDLTLPSLDSIAQANAATSTNLCRAPTGRYWCLTGNTGTDPNRSMNPHFLGTLDDASFEIRVNNQRALRIEPATTPNLIGGFSGNTVAPKVKGAVIAGGGRSSNINQVGGDFGFVGGGYNNFAGENSAVMGGVFNGADGSSVIGGGNSNATGAISFIGNGQSNIARGTYSFIPNGIYNVSSGDFSIAAGQKAYAVHGGSFVWADCSTVSSAGQGVCNEPTSAPVCIVGAPANQCFFSTARNQFSVRATGDPAKPGEPAIRFITSVNLSTGVALFPGSGTWSSVSDRKAKAYFAPANGRGILAKLAAIPIPTWSYKSQKESIRHIGPMAQDFYAAFGLGEDDKHISTIDADGIALISIQALYELSLEKDKKIVEQTMQIGELRQRIERLEKIIEELTKK